jgi:DNA topoisomerase-1
MEGSLGKELAAVERRFNEELATDLACVNTLVKHVGRFRGKMLRPTLLLLAGRACGKVTEAHTVLATVVELLSRTYIRIGNEEYLRKHKSHGLTTLQDRHVKISGRRLHFAFRGKSGVFQSIEIEEPRLAKAVRECQDLPGQSLFQYRDERKRIKNLSSTDINRYLGEITGGSFTAKDFRTWAGTMAAAQALDDIELPESKTAINRAIVQAVDQVAATLGNTRAVCRGSYIHPAVIEAYRDGMTLSTVPAASTPRGLSEAEARLVSLLRRAGRARKAA